MKRNRYTKALKHLKSTKIDEKLQMLNEIPTNNTAGVYGGNAPGYKHRPKDPAKIFVPDKDGNWPAGVPGVPGSPPGPGAPGSGILLQAVPSHCHVAIP